MASSAMRALWLPGNRRLVKRIKKTGRVWLKSQPVNTQLNPEKLTTRS